MSDDTTPPDIGEVVRAEVSNTSWSDFTAADYTLDQWKRACLIHMVDDPESKDQCKLPVREPDGTLNRNAVHAAASVLAGGRGGVDAPPDKVAAAKAAVRRLYGTLDEDVPDSLKSQPVDVDSDDGGLRVRSFGLEDIRIAATPDGRTVEAYAAVFDTPAEVKDRDGHYLEVIDPRAFNRAINRAPFAPQVFYNHGLDLFGQPASGVNTVPLGEALEVRADDRGVFTRARYHTGAFADEVLQAVRDGVITGQSFRGAFTRSKPLLRPGKRFTRRDDGSLTTVRREEIFPLVEFGPTPTPVYKDAAVLAVRAESLQRLRALVSTPDQVVDEAAASQGEEAGRSAPSSSVNWQRVRAYARRRGVL